MATRIRTFGNGDRRYSPAAFCLFIPVLTSAVLAFIVHPSRTDPLQKTKERYELIAPEEGMFSLEFDVNALQKIPLFNTIISSLHDGILITDHDGYVKYINSSYSRLTGAVAKDVLNRKIQDVRKGARLPEVLQTGKALLGIRRKVNDVEYIADISPILHNGKGHRRPSPWSGTSRRSSR